MRYVWFTLAMMGGTFLFASAVIGAMALIEWIGPFKLRAKR